MKSNKAESPATTMAQYDFMAPSWLKIQTVLDGTVALREAGRAYLPQHDNETNHAYYERLTRATLMNTTKITLDSWVGRPFSKEVKLEEGVPAEIVSLTDNIDTMGNKLDVFARNVFREGLAKSYTHIMVDMPRLGAEHRTLADDRNEGVRPYWVHIKPEDLFFAESEVINGVEQLLEVRFLEEVSKRDGFCIKTEQQIKRLVLGDGVVDVEVWAEIPQRKGSKKKEWKIIDSWVMEIDIIPIVTFYADRDSFMLGKSPIEDLSDLNIAHWQSMSDQRAVLTVARFPILACSGGTDETNKLVVGPNQWLYCPDPQGRFYYVEHSGKAIAAGRDDLLELSREMGEYGAEFLKERPSRETATARTLDSAEASSALQDVTLRFIDTMNNALALTAKWLDLPEGGTVDIHNDFSDVGPNVEDLRILLEARKNKDISLQTFIAELIRGGLLPKDFDEDTNELELENEVQSFLNNMPDFAPEGDDGDDDGDE